MPVSRNIRSLSQRSNNCFTHHSRDCAILITQIICGYGYSFDGSLNIVTEFVLDRVEQAKREYLSFERRCGERTIDSNAPHPLPDMLSWPLVEVKREHFRRTFDLEGIALNYTCRRIVWDRKGRASSAINSGKRGYDLLNLVSSG